jgi:hypothetical protein
MNLTFSNAAFLGAAALALGVAVGFLAVKPWLYVAGGSAVVGFVSA